MIRSKVVLVPFPFDDLSTAKVRPATCLTEPIGQYNHVILAFISSQIPSELLETDIILELNQDGFMETGLKVSSVLRLHRMMTISVGMIQRELGTLSPNMQSEVVNKLQKLFEID